jgi:hypothetical protein
LWVGSNWEWGDSGIWVGCLVTESLKFFWSCHFKEKEKQRQAELQEKKEIAEKKFKEWLENARNKPRPAAKSYGYANGKLTGWFLCYVAS